MALTLSKDVVMLGSDEPLIHSLIMITKQVIYSSKYAGRNPSFNQVKLNVVQIMNRELYNALQIPIQEHILEKWAPLE